MLHRSQQLPNARNASCRRRVIDRSAWILPNSFWNTHQAWRLYPDSGNPDGAMRTASGQTTPIVARIVDRGVTGKDHLQRLVEGGTTGLRETLGVPPGVCEPIADPSAVRIVWVAGFLVLRADDSVQVLSARRQPITILERKTFTKDYLRRVLQGLKPRVLDQDRSERTHEKWLRRWPQGTECCAGRECGELVIRVPDPEKMLQSPSGESAETQNIRMLLERGRDWDPFTYAIYRFVPGDIPTAQAVALLRGVRDLRYSLRSLDRTGKESAPFNLAAWWQEWQAGLDRKSVV